jgi:multisubunit Na+/H+ antiporter MnhB subunit
MDMPDRPRPMTPHDGSDAHDLDSLVPWTVRGAFGRIAASVVLGAAWLSVTLVYLGFFAHGLNLWQVLVVGIVSVLALFAALVLLWVSFGFKVARRWVDW